MKIAQVAPLAERCPPRLYGGTERIVSYLTEELVRTIGSSAPQSIGLSPPSDPMRPPIDPFRGGSTDPALVRLAQSRSTIEQRVTTAAKTFETVLARTARSMGLRAKSLTLLARPVYRAPLIARPLEPATEAPPRHPDDRG